MSTFLRFFKSKAFFIGLAILFQVLFIVLVLYYLSSEFAIISYLLTILSTLICIHLVDRDLDGNSKILWILAIMSFPLFGGALYLLFGGRTIPKKLMIKDRQALSDYKRYALNNINVLESNSKDIVLDRMTTLAWSTGYFPVFNNSTVEYFPTGEEQYIAFLRELQKAESFIFLEFFIINDGHMWQSILQVLKDKVDIGVDVRLIYDDWGCSTYLPSNYDKTLNEMGIKTQIFNEIHPQLAIQMNNRDHRKILVIDGKVAFTGGCNISDEYINAKVRFGHWKDMGCMIRGEAVETFTISFLQIWNYETELPSKYEDYILPAEKQDYHKPDGYVLPFTDSPTDNNHTGKYMQINVLNCAAKYFWISTPYLILDQEMIDSLALAVNNGVDVRIVVPGIPDKKAVYEVTKGNFETLLRKGIRIYEYSPGFIHGKVCVSDDRSAIVGTVNMDFRSYNMNYECGVWMHETKCIHNIKKDFKNIFNASREVTLNDCAQTGWVVKAYRSFLKVFSPLL
ncbi:MAG: cardiolipin synthase [Faecalicoccus sp.]|nr:cardiolipin synthase [Faecalicoccus sp.]